MYSSGVAFFKDTGKRGIGIVIKQKLNTELTYIAFLKTKQNKKMQPPAPWLKSLMFWSELIVSFVYHVAHFACYLWFELPYFEVYAKLEGFQCGGN